ncbi:MAG TPA: carboxypeptidase-like regulatory domain-containing protein, partial [Paludibacter sp.]|nr:carboxypeptidase-like regulatory domain-containing protein [Paludibacter sp.]
MKYNHFKLKLRSFVAMLVIFVFGQAANAQQISVSGIVKDAASGEPILGASIIEKSTNKGVITNFDGAFTISVSASSTLIIKYIGYSSIEVPVLGKTNLVIQLKEDAVALGEVVAIGYGVQKKTDKTGAVMNVASSEFNKGVLTDPIQALQGKASGVQITKKGGNPNDGFSVQIRGAGGFATGSNPLYVIDGIPGVDPTTIPSEDIESFNVLKDASSTAIYGSRGANGVIIITTKKGSNKGGKNTIDVNSYVSMDQVSKRLDLLSASDIRSFITRNNLSQVDPGGNTDWQNEIYRNGFTQNHNIAVGGGTENSNYRISGTW